MDINEAAIEQPGGLLERFSQLTDVRKPRGIRHSFVSVFAVAVCAVLSGADGYRAMGECAQDLSQEALQRFGCRFSERKGQYEPPSEPTLRRALQSVDAQALDEVVNTWVGEQTDARAVAVDGKAVRGAKNAPGQPLDLFSALVHREAVVIAQRAVDSKHNEITEFQPLLDPLDLSGKVVTADALHTQVEHARYLKELNRGHWEIENRLHWVRDVLFHEDKSQVRTKEGPRTMATHRNLAISLFRLRGHSNIARAGRWLSRNVIRVLEFVGVYTRDFDADLHRRWLGLKWWKLEMYTEPDYVQAVSRMHESLRKPGPSGEF